MKVKERKIVREEEQVRIELSKSGLENLNDSSIAKFEFFEYEVGEAVYLLPMLRIADFDSVFRGKSKIVRADQSNRQDVFSYEETVIKSPKRDILDSLILEFNHDGHPHYSRLKSHRVADEFVNAIVYHDDLNLDVLVPMAMVESSDHRYYLIESRYLTMPLNGEKLNLNLFRTSRHFKEYGAARDSFLERIHKNGFSHVPADSDKPNADLVLKPNRASGYQVLANDWPHFEKLK